MTAAKQWVLASRPEGAPTSENFRLEEVGLPELSDGQILVQNTFSSVDPLHARADERRGVLHRAVPDR
ncbi:hypothetical protein GCM10022417_08390 [Corynebacterium pilbarense]